MSRLEADIATIDGASARTTSARLVAGVLGLVLLMLIGPAAWKSGWVHQWLQPAEPVGRLSSWRVAESAAPACVVAACAHAAARAQPATGTAAASSGMQPMRVPASAVVRRGENTQVWVAHAGRAIPVLVREQQRTEDTVVVIELPQARGLAIAPEDWRALGPEARRSAMRAADAGGDAAGMSLLRSESLVLVRPQAGLQPGAPVKVLDGTGS